MATVFWSWQSDRPSRVTRDIFRDALVAAIDRVAADMEEAERPELDQDTKDVPGSPDIVATIFAKIESATVFVADLTPIGVSDSGKHLPNPNVLIELGYAKSVLGPEQIITLWNTSFTNAGPEDLPFDLRHRRGPMAISLPADAPLADLRSARRDLVDRLEGALRACLGASAGDRKPPGARRGSAEPYIKFAALDEAQSPTTELTASRRFFKGIPPSDVDSLVDRLIAAHPLVEDFGSADTAQRPNQTLARPTTYVWRPATDESIEDYRKAYSNWVSECREELQQLHVQANRIEPPAFVAFELVNVGSRPAAQALLEFRAKGEFQLLSARVANKAMPNGAPRLPAVPKAPRGTWAIETPAAVAWATTLRNYDPLAGVISPRDFATPIHHMPEPHDPDAFYWKGGRPSIPKDYLALTCDNWRHGIEPEIFRLAVVMPSAVGSYCGEIEVVVHAENLSRPARYMLPVTLTTVVAVPDELALKLVDELVSVPS